MKTLVLLASFLLLAVNAHAETAEIKFARQFSMGYLQFNVMEHQNLVEKHAKALGIPDVKVSWLTFNGPAAMNDGLISGSVDVVAGGVPGLLTLWTRTKGTAQEVRGITALSSQPFLLNTRNPAIKSIADFTANDKIALPSVKVSVQAVALEMEAAKLWGDKDFARLDPLTVSMSPPDSTIALLTGSAAITSVFSVPPFQEQQLENPQIHTVLDSFEIMGGSHSFTVAWTSAKFRNANPVLYKAIVAALREATDIVNADRRAAAAMWIADSNSKLPLDKVEAILAGPKVRWTVTPEQTMAFARFMFRVGSLKQEPESWRDFFFPEIHDVPGG